MGRKFLKSCPAAPPVSRWMSASKRLCGKEFGCHLVDLSPHQLVEQSCLRAKGRAVLGPEEKKKKSQEKVLGLVWCFSGWRFVICLSEGKRGTMSGPGCAHTE